MNNGFSKDRVEYFSDAVFAIILTVLVLELRVPEIANHSSISQYSEVLRPLLPKLISFALTFVMITTHWVSHHYFFRNLRSAPLGIVWLNNLLLFWLCLMPFPTALLGDHPTDQFPIIIYGINQLLTALTFYSLRKYAVRNHLFATDEETARAMGPRHSLPAITLFSLSIVSVFVNVYLSLFFLVFVPFIYFVPNLMKVKSVK